MNGVHVLFKTRAQREADRQLKRQKALSRAKTAIRRENRGLRRRGTKSEDLRCKAVEYEKSGQSRLAKQSVRQFVQMDREITARTMAVSNMEYTLDQVQAKDNYDEFVRGMQIVTSLEQLARESADPELVREQLAELAQRNQDLIEPWTEEMQVDIAQGAQQSGLSPEEEAAYSQVVTQAAGEIVEHDSELSAIDDELERKMDVALAQE